MPSYEIRDTRSALAGPKARRGPPKDALVLGIVAVILIVLGGIPLLRAFQANDFGALITEMIGWGLVGLVGLGLLFVARRRWIAP